MSFTIKVNQNSYPVDAGSDTPLLPVLRDVLGMTGNEIRLRSALRRMGIASNMLSRRLNKLVDAGLLERRRSGERR